MAEISRTARITPAQIRAVKTAQRRRGMDDREYRALLWAHWGALTCTTLTRRQAHELLRLLGLRLARQPGEQPPRPPRPAPVASGVVRLPTPAQRRLIEALAAEIAWGPAGYAGWLQGSQGLARITTSAQASRVIEGLRAIRRRRG